MFIKNDNVKIKSVMSVVFEYDPKGEVYSRKIVHNFLLNLQKCKLEFIEEKYKLLIEKFKIEDAEKLLKMAEKYNAHILFSYDSPNKKTRKHKVNFYIVPKDCYATTMFNSNLSKKSHYYNDHVYLKSNVFIPKELVSGNPVFKKESKNYVLLKNESYHGNSIRLKCKTGKIFNENMKPYLKIEEVAYGVVNAKDSSGIVYDLFIDPIYLGTPENPFFMLFELGVLSEIQIKKIKKTKSIGEIIFG